MDEEHDMKKYKLLLFFMVMVFVSSMLCACNDTPSNMIQSKTAEESQSREYAQTIIDSEAGSTSSFYSEPYEYPLVVNTLAYEAPKEGIEEVSKYFYGLEAFLQREDAKETLLRIQDEGTYGGDDSLSVVRNRFLRILSHILISKRRYCHAAAAGSQ